MSKTLGLKSDEHMLTDLAGQRKVNPEPRGQEADNKNQLCVPRWKSSVAGGSSSSLQTGGKTGMKTELFYRHNSQ